MSEQPISEIVWEPYAPGSFNPNFSGYDVGHYSTGQPEHGWCLYSRGAGDCWDQRTKAIKPPEPGAKPERIGDRWWWMRVTPAPDLSRRPQVSAIEIDLRGDGFQLRIYGNCARRYSAVKPTLEEAVDELNNWMKGVIVW